VLSLCHDERMRQQQLEVLVIDAIDRARSGNPIEDDRIEFKQAWPEPSKARQLAGTVNRANGNDVIYIVGANEAGDLFALGSTDVADWWAQHSSRFDGVAPDLQNHINIPIDDGGSVTALQFGTDRAPYVVKADKGGSPEREVPIRDGTRTRSATRAELLRMLLPQAAVPPALLLEGRVNSEMYLGDDDRNCYMSGSVSVFLEHTAREGVMLPWHDMTATIEAKGRVFPLSVGLSPAKEGQVAPAFGVHVRRDGAFVTGPGSILLQLQNTFSTAEENFLRGVQDWILRLSLGVTGSPRNIQIDGLLSRSNHTLEDDDYHAYLGSWQLEVGQDAVSESVPHVVPV
jgi:hypothetical protein